MSDIGPFYVGDLPATPITLDVSRDGEDIDLTGYAVDVELYAPGNVLIPDAFTGTVDPATDEVILTWGEETPFTVPGVYALKVALTTEDSWETLPTEYMVAQEVSTTWHNLDSARAEYFGKAKFSDIQLWTLLECARVSIEAYAPTLPLTEPFRVAWRQAQLMQVRNIANSAMSDPGQSSDPDMFVVRPFPLDNMIRQLIRPRKAVPLVG